mmetsp:Transcript_36973/g.57851  ORF Transcript_36973/g.57851 Transcript_36973/m.57851 type:complete len:260 (+) Transcript_36973:55-834(+)
MFVPAFTGLEAVACASSNASSTAAVASSSVHTTTLSYPDAPQWHYSYAWWHGGTNTSYHYQPGHTYPAHPPTATGGPPSSAQWDSSWSWYQGPTTAGDASTATLAGPANATTTTLSSPDAVWTNSYSWYPDSPGAYPASKMTWYYNNGGLYDQAHQVAVIPGAVQGAEEPRISAKKPTPATPGHMLICGNAMLLGVLEATSKIFDPKEKDAVEAWKEEFAASSRAAAEASSPLGGYFLTHHLLKEEPEVEISNRITEED